MITSLSDVRHRSPSRTALHRFAARLGMTAQVRPRAPVPGCVDARVFTDLSDHLLRDLGFTREPAARIHAGFPYL